MWSEDVSKKRKTAIQISHRLLYEDGHAVTLLAELRKKKRQENEVLPVLNCFRKAF